MNKKLTTALLLSSLTLLLQTACSVHSGGPSVPATDLRQEIQGYWIPDIDWMVEEQARKVAGQSSGISVKDWKRGMGPLLRAAMANVAMRIDGDSMETVNESSGGPNSEVVAYRVTKTDPTSKAITISLIRHGRPVTQVLSVSGRTLTIVEDESTLKFKRSNKAEFEERRVTPGL